MLGLKEEEWYFIHRNMNFIESKKQIFKLQDTILKEKKKWGKK